MRARTPADRVRGSTGTAEAARARRSRFARTARALKPKLEASVASNASRLYAPSALCDARPTPSMMGSSAR
eukprot:scaffold28954_cov144-Isochrysis_galbana.AAC.2